MPIDNEYEIEEFEFDLDDLIPILGKNVKKNMKTFEDFLDLDSALKREIYLGDIVPGTGGDVDSLIRYWNNYDKKHKIDPASRKPIKLFIDSCGGSLSDTLTMIDSIKLSKTPVWTICVGAAYSGGFFTFISGHKRIAYPHASFLFHEGSTSTGGTSGQFENYTAFYKKQLDQLKDIVLAHTNITENEYMKIRRDDIWYDTKQGIKKGFIDEIAEDFI